MKSISNDFTGKFKLLKERLKENDLGFRILIGIICLFCLAFFLHFREIKVESLELNTTANRYIVAQVDFEFPDEESMIILRQESLDDLGKIYQIDDRSLKQTNYDFENYLTNDVNWKEQIPGITLEDIYKVEDSLKNILKDSRFSDAGTKAKLKKHKISTKDYFTFSVKAKDKLFLPSSYWTFFRKRASQDLASIKKTTLDFVIQFFENRSWSLDEDKKTEETVREYVQEIIPQKFTEVKAGTKIIAQGEKVRFRHLSMLQAMKQSLDINRNVWAPFAIIGNLLLALIFVILSAFYLNSQQKSILKSLQKLSLLVCIFILTLAFSKIIEYILLQNTNNLIDAIQYPLIVPFAAILIFMLFNSRLALFCISIISIILAVTLAVEQSKFLIINMVSSLIIIVTARVLRKRKEVFEVCGKSLIGIVPVILSFNLITKNFGSYTFLSDVGMCILFMIIIAILVVGILPILESLFNVMTDITLMEYMDPNNELLKKLILESPGTYQHSLVLGNLAEVAAQAIGANALLCRVSTLYHDIGKLNNAHFFTENQQTGVNIHQLLTPLESAQVIISHIKDGVMLAKKYRLPQSFIDIILQHHGTTLVYYFYRKELELQGGDVSKVNKSDFRYPGPKPSTKESAIIMIADGIEAASRSLEEITEESLIELITQVVRDRSEDGQFDDCDLTFQDIKAIKQVLAKTLMVTRHVRIKYPKTNELEDPKQEI
jgi:putative nucleotidyltransferase with HDIG domain